MRILETSEFANRLAAGESPDSIFFEQGKLTAKLVAPVAEVGSTLKDRRAVNFIISNQTVDRYNDTVSLNWNLGNFRRAPVVLWAHDDYIPAIGRAEETRVENGALRSTAVFAERDVHPLADTVYRLLVGKFINACSVGFIPLRAKPTSDKNRPGGVDILEQELLEFSVCNIPANPDCLVQARSAGVDTAPLIGWAERVLDTGGLQMIQRDELQLLRKAAGAPAVFAVEERRRRAAQIEREFEIDERLRKARELRGDTSDIGIEERRRRARAMLAELS
ncbi:HK97 family phage prohead protease [Bradyrhizobium sp. CIR48]|uniref:HK97 family phage prohead protease n=1 Tax=Bradyrhizobium sp. CIR48 TaxID=2663840 RepID=UPI001606493D|nr:HK97 family phage prohead protease [Bradyrhizobium sp. CIR48]MBB4422308.1 HK97 family phage prohead protease [Bradyrhizobium sp. CIR48]